MDIIYIHELEIKTIIGVFDWEREQKQIVSFDLEMTTDIRPSAEVDSIEHILLKLIFVLIGIRLIDSMLVGLIVQVEILVCLS